MRTQDDPIRGRVRHRGFRRVSHGLFLPEKVGLSPRDELLRELRAWHLVLPEDAAFTHVTGAYLLGWRLPQLPSSPPVFAAVHGGERRPRRPGLVFSRLVEAHEDAVRGYAYDLPVDIPEEILLRAARDLSHVDLVTVLDSARALGHVDRRRMGNVVSSRRPGARPLAAAYAVSDPRSESGGETILRLFHRVMEVDVEPQVELHDDVGRIIGRADLMVCGTRDLHEYDGAGHRTQSQHRSDLRRERALTQASYIRRGYTLDDLLHHPAVAMHELDRVLGRPHRPERLRRWRRWVELSTYSDSGRERLLNRWRRAMGVSDWS